MKKSILLLGTFLAVLSSERPSATLFTYYGRKSDKLPNIINDVCSEPKFKVGSIDPVTIQGDLNLYASIIALLKKTGNWILKTIGLSSKQTHPTWGTEAHFFNSDGDSHDWKETKEYGGVSTTEMKYLAAVGESLKDIGTAAIYACDIKIRQDEPSQNETTIWLENHLRCSESKETVEAIILFITAGLVKSTFLTQNGKKISQLTRGEYAIAKLGGCIRRDKGTDVQITMIVDILPPPSVLSNTLTNTETGASLWTIGFVIGSILAALIVAFSLSYLYYSTRLRPRLITISGSSFEQKEMLPQIVIVEGSEAPPPYYENI